MSRLSCKPPGDLRGRHLLACSSRHTLAGLLCSGSALRSPGSLWLQPFSHQLDHSTTRSTALWAPEALLTLLRMLSPWSVAPYSPWRGSHRGQLGGGTPGAPPSQQRGVPSPPAPPPTCSKPGIRCSLGLQTAQGPGDTDGQDWQTEGGGRIKKKRRSVCLRAPTSLVCAEGAQLRSLDGTALSHRRRH